MPVFELSEEYANARMDSVTFSDLESSQISPSKQEVKEMRHQFYLSNLPSKVETDDVLNSIFG